MTEGRLSGTPLVRAGELPHEQTIHNLVERRHVTGSYEEDRHGLLWEGTNFFFFKKKRLNYKLIPDLHICLSKKES
jgi:hypothetical protein